MEYNILFELASFSTKHMYGLGLQIWFLYGGGGGKVFTEVFNYLFEDVIVTGIRYIFSIELVLVIRYNLEPNIQQVIKYFLDKVTVLVFRYNFWVICKCLSLLLELHFGTRQQ